MSFTEMLACAEARNGSLLCVGLDPEPARFPGDWQGDAGRIYDFCAAIVDATRDLVSCFKPQIAYFAAHRAEDALERLIAHIHRVAPDTPVILDAKRGDIGVTAEHYARAAFGEDAGSDDRREEDPDRPVSSAAICEGRLRAIHQIIPKASRSTGPALRTTARHNRRSSGSM